MTQSYTSRLTFLVKTAIRDSRKNRMRLVLFMSSIVLGVAALVAINSFNYNLRNEIDREAASLLGADLAASGNRPAEPGILGVLDSLPGEKAREMEMLSMSYIPKSDATQFIRLKALEGKFPFYGRIKAEPVSAAESFRSGPGALVDESLMLQYDLRPGDSIKIGKYMLEIRGRLSGAIGSIGAASAVAPAVYLSIESLDSTGLVQPGSLVNYAYYYKVPPEFDVEKWKSSRKKLFRSESLRVETIEDRKDNLNQAFGFLNSFLNLVAIVALLLGCIGVASSVLIYVRSKTNPIALLRCLGLRPGEAFLVYFIQVMALGVLAVLVGVMLGVMIQNILPFLLKDFLPVAVQITPSLRAISEGLVIGLLVAGLFSMIPLLQIRKISPLKTLRISYEEETSSGTDALGMLLYLVILAVLVGFLWLLTGSAVAALIYVGAILAAYAVLALVSSGIMRLLRRFIPREAGFITRQGLSNLFRPDNQTRTIMVTMGMGTAVLTTMVVLQSMLLRNVEMMDEGRQPNMILYGIETSQMDSLRTVTKSHGLPVIQEVPIVTMRIEGWKGKTKAEWMADTTMNSKRWAANREARVSYRDTIASDEKLVSGQLRKYKGPGDTIFVSLGTTFAEALGVEIGDEIVFNVQGTRMQTYVGSLREIEFRNLSTRFFIIFPNGVLEGAPQFQVLVTKAPDNASMTRYRGDVVRRFPNVSVVDLTTILQSVNQIVGKISFIIRFMAVFSLLTGLIVLISSLTLSKYQRLRESILLRTIGATRRQIIRINVTEYLFLGLLATGTGVIISLAASYAIARLQLKLDFVIDWWAVLLTMAGLTGVTVLTGMLNSRDILKSTPLEVLRKEGV